MAFSLFPLLSRDCVFYHVKEGEEQKYYSQVYRRIGQDLVFVYYCVW
jgi:hypothetical protein